MTHAYETWRDDMIDLDDSTFEKKYGATKGGLWQKLMNQVGGTEIRPIPDPESVAHA